MSLRSARLTTGSGTMRSRAREAGRAARAGSVDSTTRMIFFGKCSPAAGSRIFLAAHSGNGVVEGSSTMKVKVPAGVDTGTRLRSAGNGEAIPGEGAPGDLYIVFHVRPHEIFQRQGQDLLVEEPISFVTAALGGEIEVPT